MIDHDTETLIDFAEAARRLPRSPSGKPVHAKSVARWALHGVNGIRLESLVIGARRVTSVEACQRFFEALTTKAARASMPLPLVSPIPANAAQQELAKRGY